MLLNWIEPEEFSFNSLLLMDEFMIKVMLNNGSERFKKEFSIALAYNPSVLWYIINKCPEYASYINQLVEKVSVEDLSRDEVRECEVNIIRYFETLIVCVYPEKMDQLSYIKDWDQERILSITDFNNKKVLDLGSGTGRLAFAVAPFAKVVYACEPGERLRKYLKNEQEKRNITNMFVIDGVIESIPFEDDMFDIIMSGHVMGDDYEREYNELCRVLKSGGYIIDCPGEDERKKTGPSSEMIQLGFEYSHYVSKSGGDVYRYWKQVIK